MATHFTELQNDFQIRRLKLISSQTQKAIKTYLCELFWSTDIEFQKPLKLSQ